jgi:hypothetical protein
LLFLFSEAENQQKQKLKSLIRGFYPPSRWLSGCLEIVILLSEFLARGLTLLGRLVEVKKSQISKLESNANSATIDTILKVFTALKAKINFNVKLENKFVKPA